jgi:hypothetical protein
MKTPIVLIAFNRPNYFYQTCQSIAQEAKDREVYLFLDGPKNQNDVFNINTVKWTFTNFFPSGYLHESQSNIGIAFNTKKAREVVFEKHKRAIFIEDDLVLEERSEDEIKELKDEIYEDNKEARSEYNKEYRSENNEDILEREACFRDLNRGHLRERNSDYAFNNRDKLLEVRREKYETKTEEEKEDKKEYMKIYRKENAEKIAESKKIYNEEKKEVMEERINCACGSIVTRQNITTHLKTDRHKKYIDTGKTVNELRKEDYVICMCGISISKRGIKRHEGSKIHKSYLEANKTN